MLHPYIKNVLNQFQMQTNQKFKPNLNWDVDLTVSYTYHPQEKEILYGPKINPFIPARIEINRIWLRGIDLTAKFTKNEIEEMEDYILEDMDN